MSKRKSSDPNFSKNITMSDALNMFTKENHLDKKLESVRIAEVFVSSIPESSRKYIQSVNYSNGIIQAQIESASLRQNLSMAANSLCDIINEKLNQTIVHKILLT
jgi:hypothetical protein